MSVTLVKSSARKRVVHKPKTASTAIAKGELLYTTSGAVSPLSAASDERIAGVSQRTVAATDSDYAAVAGTPESMIPVLIDEDGLWEVTPSSTTNTITNGAALDWNNSTTVHVSNTTYDQFIASNPSGTSNLTKVRGVISRWEGSEPEATN